MSFLLCKAGATMNHYGYQPRLILQEVGSLSPCNSGERNGIGGGGGIGKQASGGVARLARSTGAWEGR